MIDETLDEDVLVNQINRAIDNFLGDEKD